MHFVCNTVILCDILDDMAIVHDSHRLLCIYIILGECLLISSLPGIL